MPSCRDYRGTQTPAPASVRHHEWVLPGTRLDYTPIPDPLAVGHGLPFPQAASLQDAAGQLRQVVEAAEREVPTLHGRLAHVLAVFGGMPARTWLHNQDATAQQGYMQLAARAALRLRVDGPVLTTSFLVSSRHRRSKQLVRSLKSCRCCRRERSRPYSATRCFEHRRINKRSDPGADATTCHLSSSHFSAGLSERRAGAR